MNDKIKKIAAGIEGLIDRIPDDKTFYSSGQRRAYALVKELIYQQFPELKESEDERIRKEIINFLRSPFVTENITDEKIAPWISYLEKQKEQKPAELTEETKTNLDRAICIIEDASGTLPGYQSDDGVYECKAAVKTIEEMRLDS